MPAAWRSQPDGKIVAAGDIGDIAVARYNHDGSLDTSFNGTGLVSTKFASVGYAMALQSDGKIVVGGQQSGDFALVRFTTTGSLDNAFGTKGVVTTNFAGKGGSAHALAIQADGKLVLAGSSNNDIALARYETDGHLDDGSRNDITPNDRFGSGGLVVTSHTRVPGADQTVAQDMVVDSSGRLLVDGYAHLSATNDYEPFVARYNADGSLDSSLGGTGVIGLNLFHGRNGLNQNPVNAWLALQMDGKIVVTFNADVIRLNADGSLDTASFGPLTGLTHTGYTIMPSLFVAGAVQLQCDGKIVVANTNNGQNGISFGAARLLSDGSLDSSFGTGGTTHVASFFATTQALAIQPADGYIVVVGYSNYSPSFALARFVGDDPCPTGQVAPALSAASTWTTAPAVEGGTPTTALGATRAAPNPPQMTGRVPTLASQASFFVTPLDGTASVPSTRSAVPSDYPAPGPVHSPLIPASGQTADSRMDRESGRAAIDLLFADLPSGSWHDALGDDLALPWSR